MAAVREIGGFQPTRAEDHLDTLTLAARGYRGVFVPEVLAWGNGPETFETYLRQQFAWAVSLLEVLFQHTPRLLRYLTPLQVVEFLFAQTWYALWSAGLLVLFSLPLAVLLTGQRPSGVSLPAFLLAALPLNMCATGFWLWTRRWQQPRGLRLTWRGVLLHVARWPIVFWALVNAVLRVKHPYMITPKGREAAGASTFQLASYRPYLAAVWLTLLVTYVELAFGAYLGRGPHGNVLVGYVLPALWGSVFLFAVYAVNLAVDVRTLVRARVAPLAVLRQRTAPLGWLAATLLSYALVLASGGARVVDSALWAEDVPRPVELLAPAPAAAPPLVAAPAPTLPAALGEPALGGGADQTANTVPSAPADATDASDVASPELAASAADTAPAVPPAIADAARDLPAHRVAVGVYDPTLQYAGVSVDLQHWYLRQSQADLLRSLANRTPPDRALLVTVEPYVADDPTAPVLERVVAGEMDAELQQLAAAVDDAAPRLVLLRWGHEMEISGLYPWAANRPDLYQAAYRHVVQVFQDVGVANVRWVWSPAGNPGALAYYPGDDVVDYVGLTILGDEVWDRGFGTPPQTFAELVGWKYDLLAPLGKPLVVAELGVSGTPERQADWLAQVPAALDYFPRIQVVSYYAERNVENAHMAYRPDWRVPETVLTRLAAGMVGVPWPR